MDKRKNPPEFARDSEHPATNTLARLPFLNQTTARAFLVAAGIALASIATSRFGTPAAIGVGVWLATLYAWDTDRRSKRRLRTLASILESVREADASPTDLPASGDVASFIAEWNETWPARSSYLPIDAETEIRATAIQLMEQVASVKV